MKKLFIFVLFSSFLFGQTKINLDRQVKGILPEANGGITYSVTAYGLVGDGVTDNTAALASLLTTIGSNPATLIFTSGTFLMGNISFPANITLDFSSGGRIQLTTSLTPPGGAGFVQGNGTINAATPTSSCSVTLTNTTPGNTIVFMGQNYIGDNIDRTMNAPTDGVNSYRAIQTSGHTWPSISSSWISSNIAGGTVTITATITTPSTNQANMCFAHEYSGLGTTPAAWSTTTTNSGGTTLFAGPSNITAGSLIIGFGGQQYYNETCTAGTGFIQPAGAAGSLGGQTQSGWLTGLGESFCSEYKLSSAGGPTSSTQTVSTAMDPIPDTDVTHVTGRWIYTQVAIAPGSSTVTILGGLKNPNARQIFYNALPGQGVVDFTGNTSIERVYPEWWGASPGAAAATNTPAIQAAIWGSYGCGPVLCRTNSSGLQKYNRNLHFSGAYQIDDELALYHVNNFVMTGSGKSKSGLTQTVANKRIFDGQNVAYGTISNISFSSTALQDDAHPLINLDSGSQGTDILTQFVTFQDVLFGGNNLANIGVAINATGTNNGNNINFYNSIGNGFNTAAAQLGSPTAPCFNCLNNVWSGGDVQNSPKYGLASYYGQWMVENSTFENGGLTQTGYDVYCNNAASSPCILDGVRSESMHLAAGGYLAIRNSALEQNFAATWDQGNLAGTAGTLNKIFTGDRFNGNGAYYYVTVAGTFGGLNSTTATSGSATTIVCSGCSWTINAFTGMRVGIIAGTAVGNYGVISSNTATTITVASWLTNVPRRWYFYSPPPPDSTSVFVVEPNWGVQTTSGTVTFAAVPGYAVGGVSAGNTTPGLVDIQNSNFYGLPINSIGTFRNLNVSRPDWLASTAIDGGLKSPTLFGEYTNVRVYLPFNGGWIYQGTPQKWTTPGAFSGASQWNINSPVVWSCSSARGGGTICNDVWIGGRSDPAASTTASRNILEFGGMLGRAAPFGTDLAGTDTDITGGPSTGAGVGGAINFYTSNPGASSATVNSGLKRWSISGAGHFLAGLDNTYDIGAAGANRPRNGYFGTAIIAPRYQTTLSTPASSSDTCTAGQIWADANFIYVCTATNTIKEVALQAF